MHFVWYRKQADRDQPGRGESLRQRQVLAFLDVLGATDTDNVHALPSNVKVHFWTDQKSSDFLFDPFPGPEGSVIEIPHAFLRQVLAERVVLHFDDDLTALIRRLPSAEIRRKAADLQHHRANRAVGFKSDSHRSIIIGLHEEQGADIGNELNLYVDVDTAVSARERLIEKTLSGERASSLAQERSELRGRLLNGSVSKKKFDESMGLLMAKTRLASMAEHVGKLPMPRSSRPGDAVFRGAVKGGANDPRARRFPPGPPVVIGRHLLRAGYSAMTNEAGHVENDVLAMVPGPAAADRIIGHMLDTLKRQSVYFSEGAEESYRTVMLPTFEDFEWMVEAGARSGIGLEDVFVLANKVANFAPAFEEEIAGLQRRLEDVLGDLWERDGEIKERRMGTAREAIGIVARAAAIDDLYNASGAIMAGFVLSCSFEAHVSLRLKGNGFDEVDGDMSRLFKSVFGVDFRNHETGEWKSAPLPDVFDRCTCSGPVREYVAKESRRASVYSDAAAHTRRLVRDLLTRRSGS